jgi:hypothetical protein
MTMKRSHAHEKVTDRQAAGVEESEHTRGEKGQCHLDVSAAKSKADTGCLSNSRGQALTVASLSV